MQKKDHRIRIFNQKNHGVGFTRNLSFKKATGDYIYFIDSDDYLSEDAIKILLSNALSNNSDVVITKIARFHQEEEIRYNFPGFDLDIVFKDVNFKNYVFKYEDIKPYILNRSFAVWTKFYNKKFLDEHDELFFPENNIYEDVIFHVKSLCLADKLSFEPEFLYYYRLSNKTSISNSNINYLDIFNVCEDVEKFLTDYGYMDELFPEFLYFKILQISNYIIASGSDEYFKKAKKYFDCVYRKYIENSCYDICNLPEHILNNVRAVNNSKTLEEFVQNLKV